MGKMPLTKESQFTVGEEKVLNYVMAVFFFALFGYGLFDAIRRQFINVDYQSVIFAVAILPAIYCIRRAQSNRVYIRINKAGIYQDGKLLTGWANFLKAFITQKKDKKMWDVRDNFQLVVEFRDAKDARKGIRKKIPLTNTQNKSEEDIMEAISFFLKLYKAGVYNLSP
jgi:hypothetical protein